MRKRLLFAAMAMCVAVSGFALENGEFVYTPQGRFQITGNNLNANSSFDGFAGWTVQSASADKSIAEIFNVNADGLSAGMNSVQSIDPTVGEGMYYKFEPADASTAYVISFKMKGAALNNTRVRIPGDGYKRADNLVKVAGNSVNDVNNTSDTVDYVVVNTAEELTDQWQTFNYAIVGDGVVRTYYISLTGMAETIEIADLQIAPAIQVANLKQRDAMLQKMKAYRDVYAWDEALLEDQGMTEAIAVLEEIGDESGQGELDEKIESAQEILDDFLKTNMDDYLAGGSTASGANDNYLGIKTTDGNIQKVSNYGDWTATTTGRAFWNKNAYPDLGHYAGNTAWNFGNTDDPMGVYMQKTLDAGSYVFGIESNAAVREDATSSSWTNNDALDVAFGVAYIVKIVDGAAADTIVSEVKGLEAVNYTPFLLSAKIEEGGTYEIGFKAYCKDAYKSLKNGSVTYIRNASIWGKNDNKYNQKQLGYEADVRAQIAAGRSNLTTAAEYLANDDYLWAKDILKACVDTVEVKIAEYEKLDQDAIIATYDAYIEAEGPDAYKKSTSDPAGILVYTIYQEAVKDIIAANKKFVAINDTLASIQTAIDAAEYTLGLRVYGASTGKEALQAAIQDAKDVQAKMKASQYSEENTAAIVEAIATLNAAVEDFKAAVPASAIATIVDIDFEQDAVQDPETQGYSVAGAAGSMVFSSWSVDGTGNQPFEKGYWSNGEQLWKGYIRVGNGTGTVEFDPTVDGSMGSNILKVSCDMYLQGLSGRSVGFFLKNVTQDENGTEQDNEIFGMFRNYYNGTTTTNTCAVDESKIWAKSGGSYNNASPADAEEETRTANPLEKTHFEVIMDYGINKMYCTVSSVNGSATSEMVELTAVPTKFILQSNYNNNDRRPWFDNLKIQRVTAGEVETIKGDMNGDGKVDALDIQTIIMACANDLTDSKFDITGDGKVDALDIQTIIMIAATAE